MQPHDVIFVVGLVVLGIVHLIAYVATRDYRARQSAGRGGASPNPEGRRLEDARSR